jgi:hypothetical protein
VASDERAARRPDFEPGRPVRLGDGQSWQLRRPRVELYPAVGPDGTVDPAMSFGPAYDSLLDDLEKLEPGVDQVACLMRLAVHLLRLNYDVPPEAYRELLPFRSGDPANEAMWTEIAGVALGTAGPKPSGDG